MSNDSNTTQRDELARELFIADNSNQSREQSIVDWEWFEATDNYRGRIQHYKDMAAGMIAAGYSKVDHVEYAAAHKHAGLEFADEDDELFADRAYFKEYFEEYGNATLMQRTVGPWVPLEPTTEATK